MVTHIPSFSSDKESSYFGDIMILTPVSVARSFLTLFFRINTWKISEFPWLSDQSSHFTRLIKSTAVVLREKWLQSLWLWVDFRDCHKEDSENIKMYIHSNALVNELPNQTWWVRQTWRRLLRSLCQTTWSKEPYLEGSPRRLFSDEMMWW